MVKILNQETLAEDRVKKNSATHAVVFKGDSQFNLSAPKPEIAFEAIVPMKNSRWVGSEGYYRLQKEIVDLQKKVNAAQAPSDDDITALTGKVFIDITRRVQEAPDLTSVIATEETNLEFNETVNLKEIYPYRGDFKTVSGANDSVPLLEQTLGEVDTVEMTIRALGWKTSLKNLLFNKIHTLEKVIQSVVDADVDKRNSLTVGAIVGATYAASQKQAADATAGASYDYKMYETLRKAVVKLRGLKDYRTERYISVPRIAILCNSQNTWDIERVVNGQLMTAGGTGTLTTSNLQALPIAQIIEYDQGRNNGFTWGKETLSYAGVTAGKAYVFVPREYFWVMNKRPLTMETGRGSVLQLSQEERAWYRVQAEFSKIFFGSSYDGTALGAGYGAII